MSKKATPQDIGGTVKRVETVVQDPDFPVKHRTVTTTISLPDADAETVAAFQAAAIEFNVDNQIAAARRRLPQIAGLPEHDAAATWLRRAEDYWNEAQNPSLPLALRDIAAGDGKGSGALGALDRFNEAISKGLLRKVIAPRLARDARRQAGTSEGGKARAQNRREKLADRDKRILDDRVRMLSGRAEPHEIAGKLAVKYRRNASTIRRIFKKAGVS
jgi:hypothetical protein